MDRSEKYVTTFDNTAEHWKIIDELRAKGCKFRLRGRHPNRRAFFNDNPELGRKYYEPQFIPARRWEWNGESGWYPSHVRYSAHSNDINMSELLIMRERCPELKIAMYWR